ncbi:cytochrome P450 [Dyella choica]|uniref:Cytochrome P450 n=1 Tax=Dyella choica TaxID=1927959 RepID=A0A432M8F0_9GAMM|nr:cytochrome P450 [Dyella choica]RUL77526.1 cytochrome P450 [Dyella choica]
MLRFDPLAEALHEAPYDYYARYRNIAPVHWGKPVNAGIEGGWYVLGNALTRAILADSRFGRESHRSADPGLLPPELQELYHLVDHWVMFRDPPYHTTLRSALADAFSRDALQVMHDRCRDIACAMTARIEQRASLDVMADYAIPYVLTCLCLFVGVPVEDAPWIRMWAKPLAQALDVKRSPDVYACAAEAARTLRAYVGAQLKLAGDRDANTVIAQLGNAISLGRLSRQQAIDSIILILVTGQETSRNLICNGVLSLLRHRDALVELAANPAERSAAVVEETLRFESPVHLAGRVVREDIECEGYRFCAGDSVVCCLAAANRDPQDVGDPDRFDPSRPKIRHVSFGAGIHTCLGVGLARHEARAAFESLAPVLCRAELVDEPPDWRRSVLFRSLETLCIRLGDP